jgi:hypothetical protein
VALAFSVATSFAASIGEKVDSQEACYLVTCMAALQAEQRCEFQQHQGAANFVFETGHHTTVPTYDQVRPSVDLKQTIDVAMGEVAVPP